MLLLNFDKQGNNIVNSGVKSFLELSHLKFQLHFVWHSQARTPEIPLLSYNRRHHMFSRGMFSMLLSKHQHLICTKHKELSYKLYNDDDVEWKVAESFVQNLDHKKLLKYKQCLYEQKKSLWLFALCWFFLRQTGVGGKKTQTFYIVFQWLNTDSLAKSCCPLRRLHQDEKKNQTK